jgi:hypothetical protein
MHLTVNITGLTVHIALNGAHTAPNAGKSRSLVENRA